MYFQCSKNSGNIHSRQNLPWRGAQVCPSDLCDQLDKLLPANHCSPEEHERQCVEQLRSITAWIKNHHPSDEELAYIGGRGNCVLRCLAAAATSGRWRVATAALQCLHELANHLPTAVSREETKGSTVAAGVQQEVTRLLQLHQQSPSIGHGEAVCLALRVSHSMLLCAPGSLLPATFLAACRPYLFYGLPSYRSAVQDNGAGSILQEELDSLQSSECDQGATARPNFNNRNRRKRLRRKKTQPGQVVTKNVPTASSVDNPFSFLEDVHGAQSGTSAYSRRISPLPTIIGSEEHSPAKAGFGSDRKQPREVISSSNHNARMPLQLRPPDSSELNNLCFKPQWAVNKDKKGAIPNPVSVNDFKIGGRSKEPPVEVKIISSEILREPQTVRSNVLRENCEGRSKDAVCSTVSTEDITSSSLNSKCINLNTGTISTDSNNDRQKNEVCANSSTKNSMNLESTEIFLIKNGTCENQNSIHFGNERIESIDNNEIKLCQYENDNGSKSDPCISTASAPVTTSITTSVIDHETSLNCVSSVQSRSDAILVDDESNKNNSSSDEDEAGEQRVWSRSLLTARVRQCALAAVSALVTIAGPAGKMSLWAPLLCQSPSLLHCLLTEPQAPGRAAILSLLSLLLTDSRQPLAAATDRRDRTAYSSLCHQLGSSLREMHGALGRVLVYERSSDAIVRTLKVLELLLDNVSYSKLAPGLLSGVVRMVRPYVTHSGAVVRANALSVLVSVLLVKPTPAEVPEILLRYSPPGPRTNATAALSAEDVLAHFTASSEDTAAEWEEGEEEGDLLEQYNGPEKVDVLSSVQALTLETSTKPVDFKLPSHPSTSTVRVDNYSSSALSNQTQPAKQSRPNCNSSRRTLLGWLVGQCVDALLPPPPSPHSGTTRGVYVQVQLQSLKVLHALVTDHFSLVYSRLPVLQRVISHGCRATPVCGGGADVAESGVVVEHIFPLLGAVLAFLKKECDNLLKEDTSEREGGLCHHSCLVRREEEWRDGRLGLAATTEFMAVGQTLTNANSALANQEEEGADTLSSSSSNRRSSGRKRDRELGGAVNLSDISWLPLSTSMWQWALQDPLRDLLLLPDAATATEKSPDVGSWRFGDSEQRLKQANGNTDSESHCDDSVNNKNCEDSSSHGTVVDRERIREDDPLCEHVSERAMLWFRSLQSTGEASEGARRQLVAAANTLSLLSQQVAERIGEQHLSAVLSTVLWLTSDRQPEVVAVWGVRVVGALCSLPAVQRSPLALDVVTSAVVAGTRLLQDSVIPDVGGCGMVEKRSEPFASEHAALGSKVVIGRAGGLGHSFAIEQQLTAAAVNKHRLVAVSALANIAASLKDYSPRKQGGVVLPLDVTERLLEAAIAACDDKSKIRPHGVRCLGSALGWLREVAYRELPKEGTSSKHPPSQAITWLELSPGLCQRALATLIECCSNGNNMKMRWNACHALGHLLHCPLPITGSQEWRGPVLVLLCSLVSSFPNYKVRIQASLALCGLSSRELYGVHYRSAWKALLAAATSSRNVTDYLEMRHLDDLVCQVVKGAWQLTTLATAGDCAWLRPLLLEQMPSLTLMLRRAHSCLPPQCCKAQEHALQHVTALLDCSDALTDDEVAGLQLLARLFGDGSSLPDDDVTAALLEGGTAFLEAPSRKTLP